MPTKKSDPYTERVNATDRSRGGCVGRLPLCIRWVDKTTSRKAKILDFGSGKGRRGEEVLKGLGYSKVDSYDIGGNVTPEHCKKPAPKSYDVVIMSNVLNVQGSVVEFMKTICEAVEYMKPDGTLIWNYPLSPRKWDRDENYVVNMVQTLLPFTTQLQPFVYASRLTGEVRDELDNDGRVGRLHGRRIETA